MLGSKLIRAKGFWAIESSDRPAFIYPDGTFVICGQLAEDIAAFSRRIGQRRGLIGILCDGHYRQYVSYLAALNAGCPVLLMGEGQTAEGTGLSLAYLYAAATDTLTRFDGAVESWHPDLAVLLPTSGSTGSAKWVRPSFRNIAANAASIATYLSLGPDDRTPMALPFLYSYGISIVNSHLAVGASVALQDAGRRPPERHHRCPRGDGRFLYPD